MFELNKIDKQSSVKYFEKTITNPVINDNYFYILKKWDEIVFLGTIITSALTTGQTLRYKFNSTEFSTWSLNSTTARIGQCTQFINATTVDGWYNVISNRRFHFLLLSDMNIYLKASANLTGIIKIIMYYIDKGV